MHFSSLSPKHAAILIPLILSSLVTAYPSNQKRQDGSDDSCDDEAPTSDGPTSDKSAGLGVEFECSAIIFASPECSAGDTNQAKGKVVGGRKDTNWELTTDTTQGIAGRLTAEYILDGTVIKIGDGTASTAAAAASSDLLDWKPYANMPENAWNIDGNNCNPWKVTAPSVFNPDSLAWSVQATAPLPFEAISDLFAAAIVTPVTSPLLPAIRPGKNMVSVTSKFFQSSPNGISSGSVKQDVLGFFSLVVSYAKKASPTSPPVYSETSPKNVISIMPRTEFVTLYAQVSEALPGSDTLYNLVKVLACYKNDGDDVEIDPQFCGGTVDAPDPNTYMDSIGWCLKDSSNGDQDCLLVSDWIASIQSGPVPDKLTTLDKLIDGQIGGLGNALENIVGTTRGVPIFEFRDLNGVTASKFQTITTNVESELQKLHQKYQSPPSKRRKARRMMKNGKRQAPSPCSPSAPNESLICQDGQIEFPLTGAADHFDEYCSHFDGQIYPAITNKVSALKQYYDNHAGVWIELWSNIADDDNCKQGDVKFSKGDCLTALRDVAYKCKKDDGRSPGGNAEPFNCANFGFIGSDSAPPPDATEEAVTTSQPIPTGSSVPAK